jgi:two-component system nitrogen regulation sensor histidine kinase NtrY
LSTSGKIRLLLALLFASLLFTATIVQSTYTPVNNLDQTAKILENNLQKKEKEVAVITHNPAAFDSIKNFQNNPTGALKFITDYTTDKNIWVITYTNDTVSFWSGVKVVPEPNNRIKEGVSFIKGTNGYYEAIKKSEGNFSAIFYIGIKVNYPFQNQYLQNNFAKNMLNDNNIEIADFTDNDVYGIHSSLNNQYLFSVKLTHNLVNHQFFYFELIAWLLTFLTLCVLIHAICKYFVGRGQVYISLAILAVFIIIVRYISLHYSWPDFIYGLEIFNSSIYTPGHSHLSLGDFCLNILFIAWFAAFIYNQRRAFLTIVTSKSKSYLIFIGLTIAILLISTVLLNLFYGLIANAKISFDVYNVFNLSRLSLLGLLMLCFCFLILFLANDTYLYLTDKLAVPDKQKIIIFLSGIVIATLITTVFFYGFNVFYIFLAIPVFIRAYAYKYNGGKIDSTSFIIIVFVFALIAFIKYQRVESVKEDKTRVALIQKLEVPDDIIADVIFNRIEKKIISDPIIVSNFNDSTRYLSLKNRFQKLYFDGYLSKYTYNIHEFNESGQPIAGDKNYSLSVFKDLVLYSSFKVSSFFYRENESFGFQNYFAILPITQNDKIVGTIVVELKSKPLQPSGSFPDLLKDGSIQDDNRFKNYSFAFYSDDKLVSKSGAYSYDLVNTTFKGVLKKYTTAITQSTTPEWYKSLITYSHLIYQPSERTLIVVTKEENTFFYNISSLTFFFILLLLYSIAVIVVRWLWLRIKILSISEDTFRWIFKINLEKILYKTRIQFSIVAAVVVTLIFVGFITFESLSTQYDEQQENMIRDKITHITAAFEGGLFDKYLNNTSDENQADFDELASTYSTDLVLFDTNGVPIITTQPKIYDEGLQFRRMNSRAFIYLSKFKRSEFVNAETIGELHYNAAYAPLINSKNQTIAYLELPYFSKQADYDARIISLLNIMINVYALIFIVVGLFAVIIARQITAPLSFMQLNLSKIIYGRKNEPIKWERDDEIGALVNEYNKMISALENSAQKLAQSERESAWREMAKQVAHEIKNPLTPLKLGLQLLEKSWRDKDPKFDAKFERFSKSFVEQIESLSSIASEFSSFAKMPDTRLERMNIFDMLSQAVTIFNHMDNIKINYEAPTEPFIINADRDQILRCFNNLLKNAIEASQQDKLGIIDINYLISAKSILLSLKDNGNGIPENMREKIFEPNFTTKSSGTGLGLAFVKNSIENAGGKVWFETIQGVGTTFYLSFPAAEEPKA